LNSYVYKVDAISERIVYGDSIPSTEAQVDAMKKKLFELQETIDGVK